jgi:sugar phosphate permease
MTLSTGHRRWRVKVFTATWMSYAGFYFCRKTFGIVKAPLKDVLQVDDFQLAHIWTAYLVAYMFGQFLAGWIGVRVACRLLLLVGMMGSLLCNIAFGATTLMGPSGYWPFLVFMIINGFAQATGWPGNVGTLAHWYRKTERGTIIGIWGTCYQVGSVGAKAAAAFLFGWLGLAWSFWGAAIVLFAVWILFYFLHASRPEEVGLEALVEDVTDEEGTLESGEWSPKVVRTITIMGCAYFSCKFLRYALDSWSALVINEQFGLTVETSGYISTTFDLLGFLGVLVAGWTTDRYFGGRRSTVAFIMMIGMVASAAFLWKFGLSSVLMFTIALGFLGFTLFGPDSLLSGVGVIDVGSKEKAVLAAGIINGMGSLGPVIQEEVIGWLKVHHSMDAVFLLMVGVACTGAIGTGYLWWQGRTGRMRF